MVTPYFSKLLIDRCTRRATPRDEILVLGTLAFGIGSTVIGAIRGPHHLHHGVPLQRTSLLFFNHLQHLTARFFDEHRVGEIMSRFADVRSSLSSVSKVFETIFVNGTYLVLVPPSFMLQWKLAVVALVRCRSPCW
jgi:ABC-type bacteriocin/lantibiotic exporter with double-glycine peptidase domain